MKKRYWFYLVLNCIGTGTCLGSLAGVLLNSFGLSSLIVLLAGIIIWVISILLLFFDKVNH